MAKLLLCHPLFLAKSPAEQASNSPYFPLGLLYLAAYVREQGHAVTIFDGTFEADEATFAQRLVDEKPDIVGISIVFPLREMALKLAQMAHDTGAVVLLGGPEATRDPASYAAYLQSDIVVHHEGEQTLVALLELLDAGKLDTNALQHEPGIAFRTAGKTVINQPRPPIENLDTLPPPARDLIDMERYLETWRANSGYSSMTIATSRGCPYNCDWCRDAVHGAAFRQRTPESVAAEMKALKETYQIDRLRVVDDVDGLSRAWIEDWAEAATAIDAELPFEALSDLKRQDLPLLDVRDSL